MICSNLKECINEKLSGAQLQKEEILTEHPEMEFVQLQINYADWENAAIQSRRCYETASKHNKPVIIMEPVKGGALANPPESVERILKEAEPHSSAASWAIRFAVKRDFANCL